MENVLFFIIMGGCGLLSLYLGYLIGVKERIDLIHDYHYMKVKEKDKKAYTRLMGMALAVIGIGAILSGMASFVIAGAACGIPFGLFLILGLVIMVCAQIKYNHGIF